MITYGKEFYLLGKCKEIHFRCSESVYECLKELSKRSGWTVSWIVHHATQKYLSEKGLLKK